MEEFMLFLKIAGVIGIWIGIFWLGKLLSNLKMGIDAQKAIIESMSSNANYINSVHDTVSKLYNPVEIENLVSVKTAQELEKHKNKLNDATLKAENQIMGFYNFVASAATYLDKEQIRDVFSKVDPKSLPHDIENFALTLRTGIEKIRTEAISKALSGRCDKT